MPPLPLTFGTYLIILHSTLVMAAIAHAEEAASTHLLPFQEPYRFFGPGAASGERNSGVVPCRMDSPAFYDDLRILEETRGRTVPFSPASTGSLSSATRAPMAIPKGFHARQYGAIGSFDTSAMGTAVSYGDKGFGILAGYGYRKTGDVSAGDGILLTSLYPDGHSHRYRSEAYREPAYRSENFSGSIRLTPSRPASLSLTYAHVAAGQVLFPHLKMDGKHETSDRIEAVAKVKNPLAGISEIALSGGRSYFNAVLDNRLREEVRLPNGTLRAYTGQNEGWLHAWRLKLQARSEPATGRLRYGADYAHSNPRSVSRSMGGGTFQEKPIIPDVVAEMAGAFMDYDLAGAAGFNFSAGLRGDYTRLEAKQAPGSRSPEFIEPSGAVTAAYDTGEGAHLSLSFGSGVRFPDPMTIYFGILQPSSPLHGDTSIKPTRIWQPELSFAVSGDPWEFSGALWYSRMVNYVTVRMDNSVTNQRKLANTDAEIHGGTISGRLKLPYGLALASSLAYTKGYDLNTDRPLPEMSPLTGESSLTFDNGLFTAGVTGRYGSRQSRVDDSLGEQETDAWGVMDLQAGIRHRHFALNAGVRNLLDELYYGYAGWFRDPLMSGVKIPEPGRFFYLSLEGTI